MRVFRMAQRMHNREAMRFLHTAVVTAFIPLLLFWTAACSTEGQFTYTSPDADAAGVPTPGESFDEECSQCHGDSESPAPPKSINGGTATTDMSVGAHRSHLAASESSTFHAPVLCASCHLVPDEVQSPGHLDDGDNRAELTFGALARTGGSEPVLNTDGSCSNVYCHGSTLSGGTLNTPTWNIVNATARECGSCHGAPPPSPHPADENCGTCHPSVSVADNRVFLDPSLHINGVLDVSTGGGGACDSCHGSAGNSAPPTDLAGNTARTAVGVGAHREHLALSTWRREINCSNCHVVPTSVGDPLHIDGDNVAEVPFDALNPTATVELATGTCSNLYCHGNGRGSNGTMDWTLVGPMDCNSCHQAPNPGQAAGGMSGEHDKHIRDEDLACVECHAAVVDANRQIIAPALHVDGLRNVLIPTGGSFDPANRRCSNLACHENERW